jgi:hypothetical protein
MKTIAKSLLLAAAAMATCIASKAEKLPIPSAKEFADQIVMFAAGYCKGQQDKAGVEFNACLREVADLAIAKVQAETPKPQVILETKTQSGWTAVIPESLSLSSADQNHAGAWGSFCAKSGCYLVAITPILDDPNRAATLQPLGNTGQCQWVLPKNTQVAQGQCFGQTYRVSRALIRTAG